MTSEPTDLAGAPAPGNNFVINVTSHTDKTTCGTDTIDNRASFTTSNDGSGDSNPTGGTGVTSITVNCATIALVKDADHATVNAGDDVGYTITATNTGAGVAHGFTITDALPTNTGLSW